MSEQLRVDRAVVERDAAQIAGAAGYFTRGTLGAEDGESTITANSKIKTAFEKDQTGIAGLGTALDLEVNNIRSLGVRFEEFDMLMGNLAKSNKDITVNGNSIPY